MKIKKRTNLFYIPTNDGFKLVKPEYLVEELDKRYVQKDVFEYWKFRFIPWPDMSNTGIFLWGTVVGIFLSVIWFFFHS